jgi:hypothetical protein
MKAAALVLVTSLGAAVPPLQSPPAGASMPPIGSRTIWEGIYTREQAERGSVEYQQRCSRCHGADMNGSETGPGLIGERFFDRWSGLTLFAVYSRIQSTMPKDFSSFVPGVAARDIVTYMLQLSGVPPGDTELTSTGVALAEFRIVRRSAEGLQPSHSR